MGDGPRRSPGRTGPGKAGPEGFGIRNGGDSCSIQKPRDELFAEVRGNDRLSGRGPGDGNQLEEIVKSLLIVIIHVCAIGHLRSLRMPGNIEVLLPRNPIGVRARRVEQMTTSAIRTDVNWFPRYRQMRSDA